MSMSTRAVQDKKKIPANVLILDHDETIAISEKNNEGGYVVQSDGSINATIMDKEKLRRVVEAAILYQVPIHIVTARPDIPRNREIIEGIINSVAGFHSGHGAFKPDNIHFVSKFEEGKWKPHCTKFQMIQEIHKIHYPELRASAFLFVDDMQKYLDEMTGGYLTLLADPKTKNHFSLIEKFIMSKGCKPTIVAFTQEADAGETKKLKRSSSFFTIQPKTTACDTSTTNRRRLSC